MGGEPTYNELVQRVSELEKQVCELNGVREELQKSRALYHDLVETLNDVIWEVNIDGIYTYVSPRVYHMLGYEPEELLGKTFRKKRLSAHMIYSWPSKLRQCHWI